MEIILQTNLDLGDLKKILLEIVGNYVIVKYQQLS